MGSVAREDGAERKKGVWTMITVAVDSGAVDAAFLEEMLPSIPRGRSRVQGLEGVPRSATKSLEKVTTRDANEVSSS